MIGYGLLYLMLVIAILAIAGGVSAVGLWVLYRRQGGRVGLAAWIRGV